MKLMNLKAIERAIVDIKAKGTELQELIQLTAVSALAHTAKCGDIGTVNRLYLAMPLGMRRNALADWLQKFGMVELNVDVLTAKEKPFLFKREACPEKAKAMAAEAATTLWWTCKPEKELLVEFNVQAEVAKLLKRIAAEQKKNPKLVIKGAELMQDLAVMSSKALTAQGSGLPVL